MTTDAHTFELLGVGALGFVFGYLLYYAVKHTEKFNIELLSSAIAAIGGGALINLSKEVHGWIGPYGIGIFLGFMFYLVLALILAFVGKKPAQDAVQSNRTVFLSQTLLGTPKQ